jgi:hypothetical protein
VVFSFTFATTTDPAAVLIVICPAEALISLTFPVTRVGFMPGSGVWAETATAEQTSIKLENKIDNVRTVLSLSLWKVFIIYAPLNTMVAKKFKIRSR